MKKYTKLLFIFVIGLVLSFSISADDQIIDAQDIPELHMLILQGDIFVSVAAVSDFVVKDLSPKKTESWPQPHR